MKPHPASATARPSLQETTGLITHTAVLPHTALHAGSTAAAVVGSCAWFSWAARRAWLLESPARGRCASRGGAQPQEYGGPEVRPTTLRRSAHGISGRLVRAARRRQGNGAVSASRWEHAAHPGGQRLATEPEGGSDQPKHPVEPTESLSAGSRREPRQQREREREVSLLG